MRTRESRARLKMLVILCALALIVPAAGGAGAASIASPAVSAHEVPAPSCLFERGRDSAILAGLERMYRMEYEEADSLFAAKMAPGSAGRAFFLGLVAFNRFNDRGDAAALSRAESLWTAVDTLPAPGADGSAAISNRALYRGLSTLQLSYVAGLRDQSLRAARLGRKAAAQLRPVADQAEAAAALALYDYYKADLLKGMDWVPFVKGDMAGPLRRLETNLPRSRYLGDVLQASLLWLYYDAGRYDEGLRRIDAFLSRYPDNRAYRQIRADFLFRRGRDDDLGAARAIHESLMAEYAALRLTCPEPTCLPIGYLSSVGNLVKIHARAGREELRRNYADIWFAEGFRPYHRWLPVSLKREVESHGK